MARAYNPRNAHGPKKTNSEIFVEKSTYARHNLKRRLITEKLIEYVCRDCGIVDQWNNKKLILQLDHINGINNDNRLENLRFLCPNCHSQQDTFAARNIKNKKPQ